MADRDIAALESCQLIPRLLHGIREVDSHLELLGRALGSPMVPLVEAGHPPARVPLSMVDAGAVLERDGVASDTLLPLSTRRTWKWLPPRDRAT